MRDSLFQRPSSYPLWALILASVFSSASANTAIVSMRLSDRVIVGADRKVAKNAFEPERFLCKIEKGDGFFFAWSGERFRGHGGPTFDATATIQNSGGLAGTIEAKVNAIEPRLKESYVALWNAYRLAKFPDYEKRQKPFQVIFFGMEAGVPIVIGLAFRPTISSFEVPFEAESLWSKCPGDCRAPVLLLGNRQAIERFLKADPDYLPRTEPVQAIRKFIQLEADDLPEDVGGGVDIITVSSSGPCWSLHEARDGPEIPNCPEPSPSPRPAARPTPRPSSEGNISNVAMVVIVIFGVLLAFYVGLSKRRATPQKKRAKRAQK